MALFRTRYVQFHIHAEALSGVRYLHHARDAAVVFRVGAPVVGRLRHRHVRMPLDHVYMLALEQRRFQRLAQPLVRLKGYTAVVERVLVPEEVVVVADESHAECVAIGVIYAARIGHQRHIAANALADCVDGGNLLLDGGCRPRVNLEAFVPHIQTLLGEVGVSLRRTQAVRRAVGVVCAGIARQLLAVAAQQLVNGRIEQLARQVPERDVDGPNAHAVVLTQDHLRLPVEQLTVKRVPAYQERRDHLYLLAVGWCSADVLAGNTDVRVDMDGEQIAGPATTRLVEGSRRECKVGRYILGREAIGSQLYLAYNRCLRHGLLLCPSLKACPC